MFILGKALYKSVIRYVYSKYDKAFKQLIKLQH